MTSPLSRLGPIFEEYMPIIGTGSQRWERVRERREPDKCKDKFAVAVCKRTRIKGTYIIVSHSHNVSAKRLQRGCGRSHW